MYGRDMIAYHGTSASGLEGAPMEGICLADDPSVSVDYQDGCGGQLYTFYLDTDEMRIADEDDLVRVATAEDFDFWGSEDLYLAADESFVRDALVELGFDAVQYGDISLTNREHDTIRLLSGGLRYLQLVATTTVPEPTYEEDGDCDNSDEIDQAVAAATIDEQDFLCDRL